MKYKGKELAEVKVERPTAYDPPREMLVWNECGDEPVKKSVAAILLSLCYPVITVSGNSHAHCAEIPKAKTNWDVFAEKQWLDVSTEAAVNSFVENSCRCMLCPARTFCYSHAFDCKKAFKKWAERPAEDDK